MVQRLLSHLHWRQLFSVALALLAVVVGVGAYRVATQDRMVFIGTTGTAEAPQDPSGFSGATNPVPASASPNATATTRPARTDVKAVFFGDAIVAGSNTGMGNPIFTQVASQLLNWQHIDFGFPGSGFTTAGNFKGGRDYLARLQQLRGYNIDVLFIEGGLNDSAATNEQLQAKVQAVLTSAKRLLPSATIVLMGPYASSGEPSTATVRVNAALRALASTSGIPYIDPISEQWITGTYPTSGTAAQYISTDGQYPNTKGHAYFGTRIAEDLRRLLPPRLLPARTP